jgi:hypothetical protein
MSSPAETTAQTASNNSLLWTVKSQTAAAQSRAQLEEREINNSVIMRGTRTSQYSLDILTI